MYASINDLLNYRNQNGKGVHTYVLCLARLHHLLLVASLCFLALNTLGLLFSSPLSPELEAMLWICPWNALVCLGLIATCLPYKNNNSEKIKTTLAIASLTISLVHWMYEVLWMGYAIESELGFAIILSVVSLLFVFRRKLMPGAEVVLFMITMMASLTMLLNWFWVRVGHAWPSEIPKYSLLGASIFQLLTWTGVIQSRFFRRFLADLDRSGARQLSTRLLLGFPTLFLVYSLGLAVFLSINSSPFSHFLISMATAAVSGGSLVLVWMDVSRLARSEIAKNDLLASANSRLEMAVEELTKEKDLAKKLNMALNEELNIQSGNLHEAIQELNSQRLKTKAAYEVKSRFLSTVSHELRGPLSAISTLSGLIRESAVDTHLQQLAEKLGMATFHLNGLVSDILDLNKLELGKVQLALEPLRLSDHIERLIEWVAPLARDKGISLKFTQGKAEKLNVMADPLRLRQVLLNLINNAIKFTDKGSVEVGFEVTDLDAKQCKVRLFVIDTGKGIDPENLRKIFNPFEQESSRIALEFGGTGLGLAIVKDMVDLMKGEISVKSNPGEGTRFEVVLPFDRILEDVETGAAYSVYVTSYDQFDASVFSRQLEVLRDKKVLLVDDIRLNQEVNSWLLESAGCKVVCADGGWQAMEHLESDHFDLVLMDLHMPEVDGAETTKLIRARGKWNDLLIIGLSGASRKEDVQACVSSGMNFHMTKPIEPKKLVHYWEAHNNKQDRRVGDEYSGHRWH